MIAGMPRVRIEALNVQVDPLLPDRTRWAKMEVYVEVLEDSTEATFVKMAKAIAREVLFSPITIKGDLTEAPLIGEPDGQTE